MDRQVVNEKLESLRRALKRVEDKCPNSLEQLQANIDTQDIIVLNLTCAIQLCVDIGAHIIAASNEKAPTNMGDTFDILEKMNIINSDISSSMKKAVGFRNVAVHGYDKLDLAIVYAIASIKLRDFKQFASAVASQNNAS
jgi:uncharacterized protein YutE (UPF0331/DUF86 family)